MASEDKGDIIPHQRLTINNTAALLRAVKSFALSSKLPFSENQTIVSDAPTEIPDIDDDLNRELAFYKQSLDAVTKARGLLKKEGVPFSRPADYFAEMVKSDEHMGKIKSKLIDEAAFCCFFWRSSLWSTPFSRSSAASNLLPFAIMCEVVYVLWSEKKLVLGTFFFGEVSKDRTFAKGKTPCF